MKPQSSPRSAIPSLTHTPSPTLTRLASLACALGLAGSALAQNIPRQPYADSTHTVRLQGVPKGTDWCPAGQVWSGGQCVALPTGGGATLLPWNLPTEKTFTNRAGYPLFLNVHPEQGCSAYEIYIDGASVARTRDDCEGTYTTISAIVPAGSSFLVVGFDPGGQANRKPASIRVTAMANGAKWQDTGVYWTWSEEQTIKVTSVRVPDPGSCWYDIIYRSYYRYNKDNYGGSTRVGPLNSESNNWELHCKTHDGA